MLQLDNPEHVHIGRALREHRDALGVTESAMAAAGGEGSRQELMWMVQAAQLSVLRIRRFHWLLIEAYEALDPPVRAPGPLREQWFTTRHDQVLHHQALGSGRRTAWWWGASRTPRGAGAFCYVCSTLIHPYDLGRGATHPVRLAVMNHRAAHVADLIGVTATPNGRNRT